MSVVVPPFPVGDPDGMRALAGVLKDVAAQLAAATSEVEGAVKGMTFEGPAATAFRERTQSIDARLDATATQLQDLAGRLESAASEVDAERRAYYAALEAQDQERVRAGLIARNAP
jgi:uncharacterized protein YukE